MNRFHLFALFILLSVFAPVHAQEIHLFNGKNLDGWYAWQKVSGKHDNAADVFSVEDHTIRLYGSKPGYLMSKRSFHEFKLTVEYRWNTDTTFTHPNDHLNSGIMYLVPDQTADMLWPKGIQFQVKEGGTGDFIFLQGTTLRIKGKKIIPGRSVVSKRFKDATKPIGEWNTVTITCHDNKIIQKLNGKLVNEGTDPSVTEGRIILMYEGFPIDFRKVEIKKL